MNITLIGWIVFALAIFCIIKNKKYLLYSAVFFSTFTATSILNIEKTVTGIAPFYLLAGLWMLTILIELLKDKKKMKLTIEEIKNNKLIKYLLIFIIIIILGEVVLLFRNRGIFYINLNDNNQNMLINFSLSNITQPLYIIFMIIFSIFITLKIKSKHEISKLIKIFVGSTIFALIWGLMQFCMYYLSIPYPADLFNNNISLGQLYFQMVHGIKRVNSIALEPSTFSLNILLMLPIIFICWLSDKQINKNKIKSQVILISLILLSLMIAILTTSSTAYVGIFLIMIILTIYILFFSIKKNILYKNKKKIVVFYLIALISGLIVLFLATKIFNIYWGTLIDTFKDMTINKINLPSGNERGNAVSMAVTIFKQTPILGAGWGSYRSLDLFTNILASTGILGVISFFMIIFVVLKKVISFRIIDERMFLIFTTSILVSTIGLLIAIPDLNFGYYWLFIALSYNYCSHNKGDKNENRNRC